MGYGARFIYNIRLLPLSHVESVETQLLYHYCVIWRI